VGDWWNPTLVALTSVLASSGFWAFISRKSSRRNATTRLLMGMGYYRVTHLGQQYIERGWITREELMEYQKYYVEPYLALGGNGIAERVYEDVARLPFHLHSKYEVMFPDREDERYYQDVPVTIQRRRSD